MYSSASVSLARLVLLLHVLVQNVFSIPVSVRVGVTSALGGNVCVGGDVGLTNTSIQLQYRVVDPNLQPAMEWAFLDVISLTRGKFQYDRTLTVEVDDMFVQFRLLQLEHGGDVCNCWSVGIFYVQGVPADVSRIQCSRQSGDLAPPLFCGNLARYARGFITTVFRTNGISDGSCTSDSVWLIADKGLYPPQCHDVFPRM